MEKSFSYGIIAIVAIVAIVGLISQPKVPTVATTTSEETGDLSGEAISRKTSNSDKVVLSISTCVSTGQQFNTADSCEDFCTSNCVTEEVT